VRILGRDEQTSLIVVYDSRLIIRSVSAVIRANAEG
jgi:hypothetical protein